MAHTILSAFPVVGPGPRIAAELPSVRAGTAAKRCPRRRTHCAPVISRSKTLQVRHRKRQLVQENRTAETVRTHHVHPATPMLYGPSASMVAANAGDNASPGVPSSIPAMVPAMAGVFAINMLKGVFGGDDRDDDNAGFYDGDDPGMSVIRVQVGLLGIARDLQLDLERIAERADTDSEDGLHYILTETVLSLLRNPQYWAYGNSGSASFDTPEDAENRFGALSMEERGKFREETLVNVDGRGRQSEAMKRDDAAGPNEFIVVTLLAAVDGAMRLPKVYGAEELRSVLTRLGGVRVDQVAAVEVLWTPQDVNDTLTSDELVRDYPKLVPL